jgi:hypothetical protein
MKNLLIYLLIILIGCKEGSKQNGVSKLADRVNYVDIVSNNKTIILFDTICINWDNEDSSVKNDSCYQALKNNFSNFQAPLIDMIMDTTSLDIIMCDKRTILLKGDLAFIILWQVKDISIYYALDIQFDAIESGCKYPIPIVRYIHKNRKIVRQKVMKYFNR